jgi:hypothetical protein
MKFAIPLCDHMIAFHMNRHAVKPNNIIVIFNTVISFRLYEVALGREASGTSNDLY